MNGVGSSPPIIAIVGRKNSGKTTLLVRLAAELRRRGLRIASVKHGHHTFEFDQPGRDSWRHVHEGGVEAVLMIARGRMAMVMATPEEDSDPQAAVAQHFGGRGYDLVLVEGYKHGKLPKIEIHRAGGSEGPVYDAGDPEAAAHFLALVTNLPTTAAIPVIPLPPDTADAPHLLALADLVQQHLAIAPVTDG